MACLRQEIATKIGPSAVNGESSLTRQSAIKEVEKDDLKKSSLSGSVDQGIGENVQKQESWSTLFLGKILELKLYIALFIFAFFLGRFIGNGKIGKSNYVMSSYDLELEALREMNVSGIPINPSKTWISHKFHRTHSQLNQLHEDFASVRKSIWYTLQRINDLERRVYKAEVAALMGDRLLSCHDQEDSSACVILQKQWKLLLQEK